MSTITSLVVELVANSAKFTSEMEKARHSIDSFKREVSALQTSVAAFSKFAAIGATVVTVAMSLHEFAKEAGIAEKSTRQLNFALEGLGYNAKLVKPALDDWINSMVKFTRLSDEEAQDALSRMLLFTNNLTKAQQGVKIALDVSARSGLDFSTALMLVGQMMSGNYDRIGRYIPQLRHLDQTLGSTATNAEKWEKFMEIYHKNMEGAAKKELSDYEVKLKKLGDAWGEFKEAAGGFILGPAKSVLTFLTVGAEGAQKFAEAIKRSADELRGLAAIDLEKDIRDLQTKRESLRAYGSMGPLGRILGYDREEEIKKLTIEIERKKKELESLKQSAERAAGGGGGADGVGGKGEKAKFEQETTYEKMLKASAEAEQARIELEKDFAKWLKIQNDLISEQNALLIKREVEGYAAVEKLNDAYIELSKKAELEKMAARGEQYERLYGFPSKENAGSIDALIKKAQDGQKALDALGKDITGHLSSNMVQLMSSTDNWGEKFKKVGESILQTLMQIVIKQMLIKALFNDPVKQEGFLGAQSGIGKFFSALGGIFKMQEGGIVRRPTPAIIGEAGPEAVIPLDKAGALGGRGETFISIQAIDSKSFVNLLERNPEAIISVVEKSDRAAGGMRSVLKRY